MKADYQIDSEVDEVYLPNKAAKQLMDRQFYTQKAQASG